jgi:hypothetical protein
MNISLAGARAAASRRNGAKSRGPVTPEGKARSSRNALKHGLRADKFVVVDDERPEEFAALAAALVDELAPEGALQGLLAARIARAAWRLERAERIEAELFARHADRDRNLGLALIRDGHGSRAFDTLLRYRGSALAELWRALRLLKALQAEQHAPEAAPGAARPQVDALPSAQIPIEPETRAGPDETAAPAPDQPLPPARLVDVPRDVADGRIGAAQCPGPSSRANMPIEPETCRKPGEIVVRTACQGSASGRWDGPDGRGCAERDSGPSVEREPQQAPARRR